jgi:hypothetical protein
MIKYCIILFISLSAFGQVFTINSMSTVADFETNFLLENTKTPKYYGNLNCQAFIKKLDFYSISGKRIAENYITIGECVQLYKSIKNCFNKGLDKCLDMKDIPNEQCSCSK